MNDEFESALKEAVSLEREAHLNLHVETEESHDIPQWYPRQIRTDSLPNTAAERYHHTS